MLCNPLRAALVALGVALLWHIDLVESHQAQAIDLFGRKDPSRIVASNQMFSNYYAHPAACVGGVPAQLYTSPWPTPPLVGHTYVTYQPLAPHEFLSQHRRTYFRHNPYGGWVHTRVRYR